MSAECFAGCERKYVSMYGKVTKTGSYWLRLIIEYQDNEMQVFATLQEKEMSEDDREIYMKCLKWIFSSRVSLTS